MQELHFDEPSNTESEETDERAIAIVGMAGRFPGARNVEELWELLLDGREAITRFEDEELVRAGVEAAALEDPAYVKARGRLEDVELFDAAFFGLGPREAQVLDPQHRVLLECGQEALEDAAIDPERYDGLIGVYAGCGLNSYLLHHLAPRRDLIETVGEYQVMLGNDKDFVPTRLSYKLDLKGPSVNVQTACSTSLVAVHLACLSLINYECDAALAGGVSIPLPQERGYRYTESGILSPDGVCRAFAEDARGTVPGAGAGLVVLERLADALDNGSRIYAVIKGSAINNDGALKVGYTAPSVDGQAEVIVAAHEVAGVEAGSISYVEAHGTGTELGDPIEIAALKKAFAAGQDGMDEVDGMDEGFCAVGSLKTNLGHLDAAAGVAGLMKTALALHHGELPPSLHCPRPDPRNGFAGSPFFVLGERRSWQPSREPRRAGVSSFGIGGTNAHVVLEEAPLGESAQQTRPAQLLPISARTPGALDDATRRLGEHLEAHPGISLADAAFTLQTGRRRFERRRVLVAEERGAAVRALVELDAERLLESGGVEPAAGVAFLFPGQGAQYPGMGRGLYESEPEYRAAIDECARIFARLEPGLGLDLRRILDEDEARLGETRFTQPALFTVEYALARLVMSWGIEPATMLGHSIGEYVAAHLAGVFSLDDALTLVAARGRLMQEAEPGVMLAVALGEEDLAAHGVGEGELALAAVNAPDSCVAAGPAGAIERLAGELERAGVKARRLHTSHAFHSPMMEPILDAFGGEVAKAALQVPERPFLSNLDGREAGERAATVDYWVEHLRRTVRFADGASTLLGEGGSALLELGPRSLGELLRRFEGATRRPIAAAMRHAKDPAGDSEALLAALGRLWMAGVEIDWRAFHRHEERHKVGLPTYPFERRRYWVEPVAARSGGVSEAAGLLAEEAAASTETLERPGLSRPYAAPRNEPETRLAALFEEALGVAPVGVHDDFFELGGQSLLATQLLSRIKQRFGAELRLEELFVKPTVAGLARFLGGTGEAPEVETVPAAPPGEELPLSFAQERLWLLDQLDPKNTSYNLPFAVRFTGELDLAALEAALSEVTRRHAVLRARYERRDGNPAQVIGPPTAIALPLVDLASLPAAARRGAHRRALAEAAWQRFDLAAGPVLRAVALRLAESSATALLVIHHIAADGWSMGVVIDELARLYAAAARSEASIVRSPLPELALQYADFAHWQRRRLDEARIAELLAWWRGELAGLAELELPTDRPRAQQPDRAAGVVRRALPSGLAGRVAAFAAGRGSTPFMVLLAAFQGLLRRLTGRGDVATGSPIAHRERPELEPLIGFFVNTLVLRGHAPGDPSGEEWLEIVRRASLDAFAHQDLPFERLVDELAPRREAGRHPLAPVMFALQNAPFTAHSLPGVEWLALDVERRETNFELTLALSEAGNDLRGEWIFPRQLYESTTIERLARHYETFLAALIDEPARPLSEVPSSTPAERHVLLTEWNDCQPAYPAAQSQEDHFTHRLIAARAASQPNSLALVMAGDPEAGEPSPELTYGELQHRVDRLARHLRRRGVGPEVIVGVELRRSFALVVALYAVLEAGGAYLPLDPSLPPERRKFMMEDSGARLLISDRPATGVIVAAEIERLILDTEGHIADESYRDDAIGENSAPALHPEHPAYVIYTSGSTGLPKGVMVSHRSMANRMRFAAAVDRDAALSVLLKASTSFDVSIIEVFLPLLSGGKMVMARPGGQQDLPYLLRVLTDHQIALATFPPSQLAVLLELGGLRHCSALRALYTGGETVPADLPARVFEQSGLAVENRYGPTETTISVIAWPSRPRERVRTLPIGRPIAGTRVMLVDRHLRLTAIGIPGEIALGGPGLARGYFDRPALTAERFLPDPWSRRTGGRRTGGRRTGERLYASGDLARYRVDGAIEFIGRRDLQVKVRGYRVELGEIEAALLRHPKLSEAAVTVREDQPGDRRLVGYAVPLASTAIDAAGAAEILADLRADLPEYMVPAALVSLPELPLTATGKVDRRALPAPEWSGRAGGELRAPRDRVEHALAEIWAELLGLEPVGIDDNFFEIGGDSISSLRMVARAEAVGLGLRPRQVFEHQTIAELAPLVERGGAATGAARAEQGLIAGDSPLLPIQSWFFEQDFAAPHHFNQAVALECRERLDPARLAAAIAALERHHDALRSRFFERDGPEHGGTMARRHAAPGLPPLLVADFAALETAAAERAWERIAAGLAASLDLASGPLYRFGLARLDGGDRLLITIHHLVVDGVSWRVLLEDLELAWRQLATGTVVTLPAKTTSLMSWARRLGEEAEEDAAEAAHWRALEDAAEPPLPRDLEAGPNRVQATRRLTVELDASSTGTLLTEATQTYGNRVDEILLAALLESFSKVFGRRRLLVHLEGHGREDLFDDVDLSRTVGWLTALYPVRLDATGTDDPGALLKNVKETVRAVPRGGLGWGLQPRRGMRPEVSFNYLGRFDESFEESGLFALSEATAGPLTSPRAERPHLLDLNAAVVGGRLELTWAYSLARHRPATVERLATEHLAALEALVEHCRDPGAGGYTPSDFPDVDLGQDELDKILGKFN